MKRRRNSELLSVQQEVIVAGNRRMIGKRVQVLVEGLSKFSGKAAYPSAGTVELGWERGGKQAVAELQPLTQLVGRTAGDQIVVFDGDNSLQGDLVEVEIVDARNMTLFAQLC